MQVWTFVITQGNPFRLTLPNNPSVEHDGGKTVWKMIASEELAAQTTAAFRALGATVQRYTEIESDEQKAFRKTVWLDVPSEDADKFRP